MRERVEKVKQHFKDHRDLYVSGGIIALAGTAGYMIGRGMKIAPNQQALAYKSTINQTQITITNARGHRGNQVLHNETGIIYPSQNVAAQTLGLSASGLSRHLRGDNPHVGGQTFTNLGEDLHSR